MNNSSDTTVNQTRQQSGKGLKKPFRGKQQQQRTQQPKKSDLKTKTEEDKQNVPRKTKMPIKGEKGWSPNAKASTYSRHEPKAPLHINTPDSTKIEVPTKEFIDPPIQAKHNQLGYFTLKEDSVSRTWDKIKVPLEFGRDRTLPQQTPWDMINLHMAGMFKCSVALNIYNTLQHSQQKHYEEFKQVTKAYTDLRVPVGFNEMVNLFGDVTVQKGMRIPMLGGFHQVISLVNTGKMNNVYFNTEFFKDIDDLTVKMFPSLINDRRVSHAQTGNVCTLPKQIKPGDFISRSLVANGYDATRLIYGQGNNRQSANAAGFIHDETSVYAGVIDQLYNVISNYATISDQLDLPTEPLRFSESGFGCQLGVYTPGTYQVQSPFRLSKADIVMCQTLDLSSQVYETVQFDSTFNLSKADIQYTIQKQCHI